MSRPGSESTAYLTQQLITYIGSKRALLDFMYNGINKVQRRLQKNKLKMFDAFSGSGVVARYFKQFSELLIVNDLETYSTVTNECYLSNESEIDIPRLRQYYRELVQQANSKPVRGIIAELYAPRDDTGIQPGERVFYTTANALYIDTVRQLIAAIPRNDQKYFLAPLLSEASIHANTAGVFKGFYKNSETGIGQYGGKGRNALSRITGAIQLPFPLFSHFQCETVICNQDSNTLIHSLPEVDLAYVDPPYNQHPYGSNYFMLNVITDYAYPAKISKVSGIPENWNRSEYNRRSRSLEELSCLVENVKAKFVLISFNSEGFISTRQMTEMLGSIGKVDVLETKYNTFKGSRNLRSRATHVKEYLYLLEK